MDYDAEYGQRIADGLDGVAEAQQHAHEATVGGMADAKEAADFALAAKNHAQTVLALEQARKTAGAKDRPARSSDRD